MKISKHVIFAVLTFQLIATGCQLQMTRSIHGPEIFLTFRAAGVAVALINRTDVDAIRENIYPIIVN